MRVQSVPPAGAPATLSGASLLALLLAALLAWPALAGAGSRAQAPAADDAGARASATALHEQRVLRYWTPRRMREARPLEQVLGRDGKPRLRLGKPDPASAGASYVRVATPDVPPYSVNGRIFLRRGKLKAYCSGTAINSPSRQLVLTAAHCVNSGPEEGRAARWSNFLEFVPAYSDGLAPFGAFVARGGKVFAPKQWIKGGNPVFDLGAFLVRPNAEGVNVADAVGGGATIATGLTRKQKFFTFGYPGENRRMQGCRSPYIGDDSLTYRFAGPPTMAIGCRWGPGASGGGWLIGDGTQINGVTSYLHFDNRSRTFGPYFTGGTVGKLVRGL